MEAVVKYGFMFAVFATSVWWIYKKTRSEKEHFVDWIAGEGFMIVIGLAMGFYILFAGIGLLHPSYDPDAVDPYLSRE